MMLRAVLPIGIRTALRRRERKTSNENQNEREGWVSRRSKGAGSVASRRNGNEDQDECEGWFWRGQAVRDYYPLAWEKAERTNAMKTKTNVKAGKADGTLGGAVTA